MGQKVPAGTGSLSQALGLECSRSSALSSLLYRNLQFGVQ